MTELGVFARHWTPGAVKTRLAKTVGDSAAARIYHASLQLTLQRFESVADRRVIGFTPANACASFESLRAGQWCLRPQVGDDLGARMSHFFDAAFKEDAGRVVLIGSDSPTLPLAYVEQAFQRLTDAPVVLGPAEDGGYYLIGLAQPMRALFTEIEWSTSHVYEQTLERLQRLSVPHFALPQWHDFDDEADLRRLAEELKQLARAEPVYESLLATIHGALALE